MIRLEVEQSKKEQIPKIKFRLEESVSPIDGTIRICVHAVDKDGTDITISEIYEDKDVLKLFLPSNDLKHIKIITVCRDGSFGGWLSLP